jgi:hypothetical protein
LMRITSWPKFRKASCQQSVPPFTEARGSTLSVSRTAAGVAGAASGPASSLQIQPSPRPCTGRIAQGTTGFDTEEEAEYPWQISAAYADPHKKTNEPPTKKHKDIKTRDNLMAIFSAVRATKGLQREEVAMQVAKEGAGAPGQPAMPCVHPRV